MFSTVSAMPRKRALFTTMALIALLSSLVAVFAIALIRAERLARRRLRMAKALQQHEALLLEAVQSLTDASRISSGAVMDALADALLRCDPSIDAFLAFLPEGEELQCALARGERAQHYDRVRLRRDTNESLPARAALDGHRATGSSGLVIPTDRAAVAVPVHEGGSLRAVVYVSSANGGPLHGEDSIVRTVEHAASPFALAIEREADRADATYDSLTGLLTPRAFRERLREEVERARFKAKPQVMTLWFIDTDHFKTVNDRYGHAAGDRVLRAIADLLRAHTVAELDVAARNGGDEFCALIFSAQKTVAIERAQALCEAVRAHEFGLPLRLTASIGVATFPYDAQSSSELLEVADSAMYHSKHNGRDRVSFAVNGTTFSIYR
jgi:diguanylate cyclase (GGDEF)-like protein